MCAHRMSPYSDADNTVESGPSHFSLNQAMTTAGRFFPTTPLRVKARTLSQLSRPGHFFNQTLHEDRATQGCDPSACSRRRAGRGLTPFPYSPQPSFALPGYPEIAGQGSHVGVTWD